MNFKKVIFLNEISFLDSSQVLLTSYSCKFFNLFSIFFLDEIAFYDALDDLCSRFLINLPARSKRNMIRLGFEIELAHWYYLDCYRSLHPEWPMYKIKEFMLLMFSRYDFLVKPKNQDIQAIYSK